MPRFLQIAQLGNPVLQERASEIEAVQERELVELIDDMIATTLEMDGVGLAAPQVYQSKRLIIVASRPNARYPYAPLMQPTAMINPIITKFSEETNKDWEGCLSAPGVRGLVSRPSAIQVDYLTRQGEKVTTEFTDFVARVVQHEVDHLDGISFLDRMDDTREIVMEKEFLKILARKKAT